MDESVLPQLTVILGIGFVITFSLAIFAVHYWEKSLTLWQADLTALCECRAVLKVLEIVAAWQAGELSEEQACELTGMDCFDLRGVRDIVFRRCAKRWQEWRAEHPPQVPAGAIRAAEGRPQA